MSSELSIICMDHPTKENKKIKNLNPMLPKPPFRWSIVGASGSGKSNMICNLFRKEFYNQGKQGVFIPSNLFIFSPTADLDPKIHDIKCDNFFTEFDEVAFIEIFSQQEAILKQYGKKRLGHVLIILDDMLGDRALNQGGLLSKYIFRARHYNVSIIFSVQKYSGLPRVCRLNCNYMSIFRCGMNERDFITEEHSDKKNRETFRLLLQSVFAEPFQFLHIECENPDLTKRYRKNFEEILEYNIK